MHTETPNEYIAVTIGYVSVELRLLTVPMPMPQMVHEWIWIIGVMILTGKTERLGEKPVPVALRPPQVTHALTWARNRASAVKNRRLIA